MNKQSPVYIITFMVILCAVFGTGVSFVHYATQGLLAKNEQLHHNRILAKAFQLHVDGESAVAYEEAIAQHIVHKQIEEPNRTWNIYLRISDQYPPAVGFEVRGMGFWDLIRGILVLSPDLSEVQNIQFLEQKETPGLGARIEEAWFTDQFHGIKIAWNQPNTPPVIIGQSPDPTAQNQVDSITGATQTSMALMNFLNAELQRIRNLDLSGLEGIEITKPGGAE